MQIELGNNFRQHELTELTIRLDNIPADFLVFDDGVPLSAPTDSGDSASGPAPADDAQASAPEATTEPTSVPTDETLAPADTGGEDAAADTAGEAQDTTADTGGEGTAAGADDTADEHPIAAAGGSDGGPTSGPGGGSPAAPTGGDATTTDAGTTSSTSETMLDQAQDLLLFGFDEMAMTRAREYGLSEDTAQILGRVAKFADIGTLCVGGAPLRLSAAVFKIGGRFVLKIASQHLSRSAVRQAAAHGTTAVAQAITRGEAMQLGLLTATTTTLSIAEYYRRSGFEIPGMGDAAGPEAMAPPPAFTSTPTEPTADETFPTAGSSVPMEAAAAEADDTDVVGTTTEASFEASFEAAIDYATDVDIPHILRERPEHLGQRDEAGETAPQLGPNVLYRDKRGDKRKEIRKERKGKQGKTGSDSKEDKDSKSGDEDESKVSKEPRPPKSRWEKGESLDLTKFKVKVVKRRKKILKDPDSDFEIEKDISEHGSARGDEGEDYWKLYKGTGRDRKRIGTFAGNSGKYLRK